jgi:uncharacterized protein
MANRLSSEKSPYLLQHANNPVQWYPWGEEAFKKAAEEDKPIFLSIGYATCHWCHVMERESFEDEEVAGLLNEKMISIKVDREERADVDDVYMTVCQALTGRGGWPLSIFMTPERKPFFAGTYFPKLSLRGMPGFVDIINHLAGMWENQRERIFKAGEDITSAIQPKKGHAAGPAPQMEVLRKGYEQLQASVDHTWGGFGTSPKFPTTHNFTFLLRWHRREPHSHALGMVLKSLDAMRAGGIFDQIGFGFHRYSVDQHWLVPHFEKMLYDQALLAIAYTEAFQVTEEARYGQVAREIFEYVLRDMTSPEGGFYSAEDADSEGEEGLFYVWTPEEVKEVLGEPAADIFCRFFDISAEGNFENHKNIPHITKSLETFARISGMEREELENLLTAGRVKLFEAREKRIHPLKDDKVLTSWNGLMIAALAMGHRALRDPLYARAASRAADFILDRLRDGSGRLHRRYRQGEVAHPGYLEDYAFLVWGLLELYASTFEVRYLEEAVKLNETMLALFWDETEGGLFFTPADGENLIVRDKQIYDGAMPSGNSVAALNLVRLARMTGNPDLEARAQRQITAFTGLVGDYPQVHTHFLQAMDFILGPSQEVVIAGETGEDKGRAMVDILHAGFSPHRVVMALRKDEQGDRLAALCPFVAPMQSQDHEPTVYVCENFACKRPVTEPDALKAALS